MAPIEEIAASRRYVDYAQCVCSNKAQRPRAKMDETESLAVPLKHWSALEAVGGRGFITKV